MKGYSNTCTPDSQRQHVHPYLSNIEEEKQCIGSGSVGSARFWLPRSESGSAKICGSTDPDPKGKISTKNCKNNFFTPKIQL